MSDNKSILELTEEIYWLELQNLSGREDFQESFRKGITAAIEHLQEHQEQREKELIINARVSKDISIAENVLHWNPTRIAKELHKFEADALKYYQELKNQEK